MNFPILDLIARIKVMYLAAFAEGDFCEKKKEKINEIFESYGLKGDALYLSKRLAMKTKAELDENGDLTVDEYLMELSEQSSNQELANELMILFLSIAKSDGDFSDDEKILAADLADSLELDIDCYLSDEEWGER